MTRRLFMYMAPLLALLVVLCACTGAPAARPTPEAPPAAPQEPVPEPAVPVESPPAPPPARESRPEPGFEPPCLKYPGGAAYGSVLNRYVQAGTCATRVHSENLWVSFWLPGDTDPVAVRTALRTTGAAQPEVQVTGPDRYRSALTLDLHYPPGQAGDRLEIRLTGPFGKDHAAIDLGFVLERVATPGLTLEWRTMNGEWRPVAPVDNLPRQALQLRLRLRGGLPPAEVEKVLAKKGLTGGSWTAPDTLVATLADPPALLALDFSSIRTADALYPPGQAAWEFFAGAPPSLVVIDPATGREEKVGEAPLDVARGSLSPDGRWVALFSVHPESRHAEEAWVMETATGRLYRLGTEAWWPGDPAFWTQAGLTIPNGRDITLWRPGETKTTVIETSYDDFVALSPDGRYLAGYDVDWSREGDDFMAPARIGLFDMSTLQERVLAVDKVKARIPHSEYPLTVPMQFTPDGQGLIIREGPPVGTIEIRWLRLDMQTGERTELPGYTWPEPPKWLTSPAGYQVPRPHEEYGPITVTAPDGSQKPLGDGLVLGWLPDGRLLAIRWENGAHLRPMWSPF